MFYTCSCGTMAFALFNVVIASFLVVNAQGLNLRGPPNSLARSVEILSSHWPSVRASMVLSLLFVLLTVISICWMKLEEVPLYPGVAIGCTVIVIVILMAAAAKIASLSHELRIEQGTLVAGDLTVSQQQEQVDLLSESNAVIPVART